MGKISSSYLILNSLRYVQNILSELSDKVWNKVGCPGEEKNLSCYNKCHKQENGIK